MAPCTFFPLICSQQEPINQEIKAIIYSPWPGCLRALVATLYTTVSCLCQDISSIQQLQKGKKKPNKPNPAVQGFLQEPARGMAFSSPCVMWGQAVVPIRAADERAALGSPGPGQVRRWHPQPPGAPLQRRHVKAIKAKPATCAWNTAARFTDSCK